MPADDVIEPTLEPTLEPTPGSNVPAPAFDPQCELCEAAPLTQRYHEDELCWVAECESCFVPMVVWKRHDPNPPEEVRVVLLARLSLVVETHPAFAGWKSFWLDGNMRSIPSHFHVHARPRGGFAGFG